MKTNMKFAIATLITTIGMATLAAPAFADDGGDGSSSNWNNGWWPNWLNSLPASQSSGQSTVTLSAGWNLVDQSVLDALNLQASQVYSDYWNGHSYQPSANSEADGLWVYTSINTTVSITPPSSLSESTTISANTWGMVGNPYGTAVSLSLQAGDVAYTYDSTTGQYSQPYTTGTVALAPGQGAWLFSASGGTYTVDIQPPSPPSSSGTVTGSVYGNGSTQ